MAIETSPSAGELRAELESRGVEFVFAQFVDLHGKPNAKLVPVGHLEDLFAEGAGFAGFAAGDIGQGPHDPDIAAMPDARSLTYLPWKPEVARFACDVTVEGEPWPDLTGGYRYLGLERMSYYVNKDAYRRAVRAAAEGLRTDAPAQTPRRGIRSLARRPARHHRREVSA